MSITTYMRLFKMFAAAASAVFVFACNSSGAACAAQNAAKASASDSVEKNANADKPERLFQDIKITHGPYVQSLTETSATVIWTTDCDAVSWVEIAPADGSHFYEKNRQKFYQAPLGRKLSGKLHSVKIDGLKPDTTYNYRVFSTKVMCEDGEATYYGFTASTRVYQKEPLKIKTLDTTKKSIAFSVLNDVHQRVDFLNKMLAQIPQDTDFLLLNGDMVNNMVCEEQIFKGFLDDVAKFCEGGMPMFFARGNHETRGTFSGEYLKYFPTNTDKTYYTFRVGIVYFVVLDSGEDKPDNDIEYFERADFDNFRTQQAKWLKSVVNSAEFKNAPVKILISHIPPAWGDWHGSKDFQKKFRDIVNGANFSLIVSGHLHTYRGRGFEASKELFNAYNVVNTNQEMLNIRVDENKISVDFVDVNGNKTLKSVNLDVKK